MLSPPSGQNPQAIRDDLAHWVEDNVDALIRAFASDNDGVIVAADEGGVVNSPAAAGGTKVN